MNTTERMTPERQRIAIAEACGWRRIVGETLVLRIRSEEWIRPGEDKPHGFIPLDYPTDLNAMHEAEETMTALQRDDYTAHLLKSPWAKSGFQAIHATAAKRAEAFLRTIGKWEE